MIELSDLQPPHEEEEPLNRPVPQSTSVQVENLEPDQAKGQNPWKSCNKPVKGKCKLWMAIVSIFIAFIAMIFISLIIHEASYRDEDENEELELAANKTFLVTLKIPEECVAQEDSLSNELSKRLTTLYSSSPALSRYFASVEIADSSDNSTVAYHLHFAVPSDDAVFMKYMMSEELVLGILRQNFNDKSVTGCETLGIDPASLSLS
ncbi:TPA-induced transmembrane protein [Sminthopsis crassicaudata]|uniref:TPA-induced transmembrane protein n=1 Tax=Sminthopsis crassicaudata TaxID=9301 RepID=UPI003D680DF2